MYGSKMNVMLQISGKTRVSIVNVNSLCVQGRRELLKKASKNVRFCLVWAYALGIFRNPLKEIQSLII